MSMVLGRVRQELRAMVPISAQPVWSGSDVVGIYEKVMEE